MIFSDDSLPKSYLISIYIIYQYNSPVMDIDNKINN